MPAIEQLKAEYDGEWLAINVTASDKIGATEGELIYHSDNHDEVWRRVHEILKEKRKDCDIAVFYSGPSLPEGVAGMINFSLGYTWTDSPTIPEDTGVTLSR